MEKKSFLITSVVTVSLFLFVSFLLYVIYCFSFYDRNQENEFLVNFNTESFDFVYDNMYGTEHLTKEEYNYGVNLMFRKNLLNEIYNLYYSDMDKQEFLDNYYFLSNVKLKDIKFIKDGKTNLFNRRNILYYSIKITSNNGNETYFVVRNGIKLLVKDDSNLIVDDRVCNIKNNVCSISYVLGGLHTIKYEVEGIKYFGLLLINEDNISVDVSTIDSLVKIVTPEDTLNDIDINLSE